MPTRNISIMLKVRAQLTVDDAADLLRTTRRAIYAMLNEASFHDFDEFERLVEVARSEALALLVVLLGGEAGLRCGEMMALEWTDVDFAKRQLYRGAFRVEGPRDDAEGRAVRYVPMTRRLTEALREARHLRGPRVLCDGTGKPLTQKVVQVLVRRTARRANVKPGIHILRHTFCSHLAMRGAPARAIQELAGHQDLTTTQRYMHLSPAAIEGAIRLLDASRTSTAVWRHCGRRDLPRSRSPLGRTG